MTQALPVITFWHLCPNTKRWRRGPYCPRPIDREPECEPHDTRLLHQEEAANLNEHLALDEREL